MLPKVKKVKSNPDFTLSLVFTNGESRRFNAKPYLEKGIFKYLKDWKQFSQARVSLDTVVWPNELDIAPETLYFESISEVQ